VAVGFADDYIKGRPSGPAIFGLTSPPKSFLWAGPLPWRSFCWQNRRLSRSLPAISKFCFFHPSSTVPVFVEELATPILFVGNYPFATFPPPWPFLAFIPFRLPFGRLSLLMGFVECRSNLNRRTRRAGPSAWPPSIAFRAANSPILNIRERGHVVLRPDYLETPAPCPQGPAKLTRPSAGFPMVGRIPFGFSSGYKNAHPAENLSMGGRGFPLAAGGGRPSANSSPFIIPPREVWPACHFIGGNLHPLKAILGHAFQVGPATKLPKEAVSSRWAAAPPPL